jgi:FG-GAP repeat
VLSSMSKLSAGSLLVTLASWSAHAELPVVQPISIYAAQVEPAPGDPNSRVPAGIGADVDMYGNVSIAGSPAEDYGIGSAYVWTRNGTGGWDEPARLFADIDEHAEPFSYFGTRVALLDGRAVIASEKAIYLFVRQPSGEWLQKDKHEFAGALRVTDLDWQGNLLAVGVLGDSYQNYAFAYDSSQPNSLRKIARFAPPDAVKSDGFGSRVAVYGSTVVATAPGYNNKQGAAYVYTCSASACAQNQKIVPISGAQGDQFGSSVDINGIYLVIGASTADQPDVIGSANPSSHSTTGQRGSVHVFTRSGNVWAQTQTLHPTTQEYSNYGTFGYDVTIQGSRLLVGSPYNSPSPEGLVFEYALNGAQWFPRAVMRVNQESFGQSTSLIGQYAIVGKPGTEAFPEGEAYQYKLP